MKAIRKTECCNLKMFQLFLRIYTNIYRVSRNGSTYSEQLINVLYITTKI